jgi:hypothetical protein
MGSEQVRETAERITEKMLIDMGFECCVRTASVNKFTLEIGEESFADAYFRVTGDEDRPPVEIRLWGDGIGKAVLGGNYVTRDQLEHACATLGITLKEQPNAH